MFRFDKVGNAGRFRLTLNMSWCRHSQYLAVYKWLEREFACKNYKIS